MADSTSRALEILNLLQTHQHWPGSELAVRLGVTDRTVRRDIDRLRELGYRIDSLPGAHGGYRLEAGSAVPPLLLNDDEAVAMAIGLRVAAARRLVQGPETTLTALAKLEQVLPAPLRRRVNALAETVRPAAVQSGAPVSTEILGELALACRDHERIRFDYVSRDGKETTRRVEPHGILPADRNWYLVAWDLDRDDWRTFRVDRASGIRHTRILFSPRAITAEEMEDLTIAASSWSRNVDAQVVMDLPFDEMKAHFGPWGMGASAEDDSRTRWPVDGGDFRETIYGMTWIPEGVEYRAEIGEPARSEIRETLERMLRALER